MPNPKIEALKNRIHNVLIDMNAFPSRCLDTPSYRRLERKWAALQAELAVAERAPRISNEEEVT